LPCRARPFDGPRCGTAQSRQCDGQHLR
jgi:hypothetical protein